MCFPVTDGMVQVQSSSGSKALGYPPMEVMTPEVLVKVLLQPKKTVEQSVIITQSPNIHQTAIKSARQEKNSAS